MYHVENFCPKDVPRNLDNSLNQQEWHLKLQIGVKEFHPILIIIIIGPKLSAPLSRIASPRTHGARK